jgi:hypothetical protein
MANFQLLSLANLLHNGAPLAEADAPADKAIGQKQNRWWPALGKRLFKRVVDRESPSDFNEKTMVS